jgi:hypothetical protein
VATAATAGVTACLKVGAGGTASGSMLASSGALKAQVEQQSWVAAELFGEPSD